MSKKNTMSAHENVLTIDSAKNAIKNAFGNEYQLEFLEVLSEGDVSPDVKLSFQNVFYSVSIITSKHNRDNNERWIYSVMKLDEEVGSPIWKYVHPITSEVFDDPNLVDFTTLPFVA